LSKFKPWLIRQENAWGDTVGSDEVYISEWEKFLQTEFAHNSVPDWNSKLEDIQEFLNDALRRIVRHIRDIYGRNGAEFERPR